LAALTKKFLRGLDIVHGQLSGFDQVCHNRLRASAKQAK
jgi:hypothetical protein